jgi:putative hemolysin
VAALGRLPDRGDVIEIDGHSLEVVALDGRRVSRLRLTSAAAPEQAPTEPTTESAEPGPDRLTE